MNVVTQNNFVLLPGFSDDSVVAFPGYDNGRMGPPLFTPGTPRDPQNRPSDDGKGDNNKVRSQLCQLAAREVIPPAREVPSKPAHRHEDKGYYDLSAFEQRGMMAAVGIGIPHHNAAAARPRKSVSPCIATRAIAQRHKRRKARRFCRNSLSVQRLGGTNMAVTR